MAPSLLVVSHDFGELANARQWIEGGELECRIIAPSRLMTWNAGTFPHAKTYASEQELLRALDECSPEWLLLFSGYLLASQPAVGVAGLRRLLEAAARRGVRIATTDPFLGLVPRSLEQLFSNRLANATQLRAHFQEVGHLLEAHDHLYLAPTETLATPRAHAFFHPAYHAVCPAMPDGQEAAGLPSTDTPDSNDPCSSPRPYWLFVLSSEDGQQQVTRWGQDTFCSLLHDRMRDAHRCHRRTVFIGPPSLVHGVQRLLEASARESLGDLHSGRDFCGLDEFRELQQNAEHAFYWNPLSNSIVSRLVRGQSVFFLDEGHMARSMPALHAVASRHYFQDATVPIGELNSPWSLDALAFARQEQRRTLAPARDAVLRLPPPAAAFRRMQESNGPADQPPASWNAADKPSE